MSVPMGMFPKLKRTMSEEESLTSSEYANGDLVCGECGLVLSDHIIDNRSEWRTFQNDDNEKDASQARVDAPFDPFLPGAALEITILQRGKVTSPRHILKQLLTKIL
ncbi:TFIIB-domain-containing protein [Gigaspora margarita]|uniref:TFIIB-domain-containing protein n=1 Tax=Gigaspora margarita TaxID=4874 RepID=A0A8H4B5P6_GIGMA|nr:TFIIB-domain-containing protein [Gigaspora margarita]